MFLTMIDKKTGIQYETNLFIDHTGEYSAKTSFLKDVGPQKPWRKMKDFDGILTFELKGGNTRCL